MRKGGTCVLGDWWLQLCHTVFPCGERHGVRENHAGTMQSDFWLNFFLCVVTLCVFLVFFSLVKDNIASQDSLWTSLSELLFKTSQIYVTVLRGKESTGEILSVNYLFYGSQEYHTQQSAQLNRIFHESFLSFWAAWGNVCLSDCQREQQQPFWYCGTTNNPREPSPLSPECRQEQSGSKFRPWCGFVDAESETPTPSILLSQMQLTNPHQSYIQQRILAQPRPWFFFLSFFPSSSTSFFSLLRSLFGVKEMRWLQ